MPRRPKEQSKQTVTVIVGATPVPVPLHPPAGNRSCWYAYWAGAGYSRTTKAADPDSAAVAAQEMVRRWAGGGKGDRPRAGDSVLSDEEFKAIQRAHHGRHTDPYRKARAAKTLDDCLEAIDAFRAIIDMPQIRFGGPLATANPDVCAAFQRLALDLPRNWRKQYPRSKPPEEAGKVTANTVLKWTRQLQASFERANMNAGKKCVRGVVPAEKLLTANPWGQFTSIEGQDKPIRQYDGVELVSLLGWFAERYPAVTVAPALAKLHLWSQCRRAEVTSLKWSQFRGTGPERHFEVVGKWGVEKWFRVPAGLFRDLEAIRTSDDHVFAAYPAQLRLHYQSSTTPWRVERVMDGFRPENLGDWFHARLIRWSESLPKGRATSHVFRKTGLQCALEGESGSSRVAADARVSERVLMTNYAEETDPIRRNESNRNFARIAAGLGADVAALYGHEAAPVDDLPARIQAAVAAGDWGLVKRLSAELAG